MLSQMMISMMDVFSTQKRFFRYVLIGLFNLTIFYGLYEFVISSQNLGIMDQMFHGPWHGF